MYWRHFVEPGSGRPKIEYFDDLVSRIRSRVKGWLGKLISFGGRITLIQSVLTASTIHILASSPVPRIVLQCIASLLASFLWNAGQERRHHWVRWSAICRPSNEGGLGLRSLSQIMEGLRAKLAWRFWEQDSMWARFMASKYGHPSGTSALPSSGSALWSRIQPLVLLLRSRVVWILGSGMLKISHMFLDKDFSIDLAGFSVKDIMEDPGKLSRCPEDVQESLSQVRLKEGSKDRLVWSDSASGRFSPAGFLAAIYPAQGGRDFEWLWVPWLPRKIGGFLWRLLNNAIPVDTRIQGQGIPLCSKCRCCNLPVCETVDHLFITSDIARSVWIPMARRQTSGYIFILVEVVMASVRPSEAWMVRLLPQFMVKRPLSREDSLAIESLRLPVLPSPIGRVRWIAWDPGPGLTLNVDGSSGLKGASGVGVVRGVSGEPKLLFATRFSDSYSSVAAEFGAALEGFRLAREHGLQVMEMQSDSKVLVDALRGEGDCPWSCEYVFRDILKEMNGVRVVHLLREANRVADRLASFGLDAGSLVAVSPQMFSLEVREALRWDSLRFSHLGRSFLARRNEDEREIHM
uniref:RNase H type-1 domain-containing protein n=1 Tax=Kalanchoe fedtschenkoi TaxID=63787 RepID=A0A7N0V1C9_KALFE